MEAFESRDFRRFQLARVAAVLGYAAQSVAVAWQVYSITHRAIDLGYTGLAQFLPGLLCLLPAGHIADRFDRRQIILVCYGLQALCTAALLLLTRAGLHGVFPIYVVLFFIGTARTFSGPANSALIPHLVPEAHFVNAVTWGATTFQFATTIGPALGGVLFTLPLAHLVPGTLLQGPGIVYVFTLAPLAWSLALVALALATLPPLWIARLRLVKSATPRLDIFSDMNFQPKYKAQAASPLFAQTPANRAAAPAVVKPAAPASGAAASGSGALRSICRRTTPAP